VTTQKSGTLILNVDGAIAASFCDLLSGSGAFSEEEAAEYLKIGTLNGLFVLGRSIGFIGHYLDQKQLKQPLYRHRKYLFISRCVTKGATIRHPT
jgi:ATP citrate (pro-S)-lyase